MSAFSMRMGMGLGAGTQTAAELAEIDYGVPESFDVVSGIGTLWGKTTTPLTANTVSAFDAAVALYETNGLGTGTKLSSIGTSQDGAWDIWAYELEPASYTKTGVIVSGIHGNERLNNAGLLYLMQQLADPTNMNPVLHKLRGYRLYVIPVANPFGFNANTRNNGRSGGTININRNFDYNWLGALSYSGSAAESEAETEALVDFLVTTLGLGFDWLLDCHDCYKTSAGTPKNGTQVYGACTNWNNPFHSIFNAYDTALLAANLTTLTPDPTSLRGNGVADRYMLPWALLVDYVQDTLGIPAIVCENQMDAGYWDGGDDEYVTRAYEHILTYLKGFIYIDTLRDAEDGAYYNPYLSIGFNSVRNGNPAYSYEYPASTVVPVAATAYSALINAGAGYNITAYDVDGTDVLAKTLGSGASKMLVVGVADDATDYLLINQMIAELTANSSKTALAALLAAYTITFLPTANPAGTSITDWNGGAQEEVTDLHAYIAAQEFDYVIAIAKQEAAADSGNNIYYRSDKIAPTISAMANVTAAFKKLTDATYDYDGATLVMNSSKASTTYNNTTMADFPYENQPYQYGDLRYAGLVAKFLSAIINTAAAHCVEYASLEDVWIGDETETQAYVEAGVDNGAAPFPTANIEAIDDLVAALKTPVSGETDSIFDKLDSLIISGHDENAALIDIINPSNIVSNEGDCGYTTNSGWTGGATGSAKHLDSNKNLTTTTNYTGGEGTMFGFATEAFTPTTSDAIMGIRSTASTDMHYFGNYRLAAGNPLPRLLYNAYSDAGISGDNGVEYSANGQKGLFSASIKANPTIERYNNGVALGSPVTEVGSYASGNVPDGTVVYLARRDVATGVGIEMVTGKWGAFGLGGYLTAAEHLALYNALNTYFKALGLTASDWGGE